VWKGLRCGALGLVVAVTACGGGDDPEGYGAEHRDEFVDDCAGGGIGRRTCGCFYDHLRLTVPFERFERLDEELRIPGEDLPADLATMLAGCAAPSPEPDEG
jgi:hypothetical protein